jgi:hypothetical protein
MLEVAHCPEPFGVRPLGGTRKVMVAYEGGVFLRWLGWYGETAASRMVHPNQLRLNSHHGLRFASCHPCSGMVTA